MKNKGRVTIPTDSNFIEGTKKIIESWGADAIRDCDGVNLPQNPKELADKVYNVYFLNRGDYQWAANNTDEWQHMYLMTSQKTAYGNSMTISIMDEFYDEQVKPAFDSQPKKYWEVINRTTGEIHTDWTFDKDNNTVTLNNVTKFNSYTLSFLAKQLWHPVHMYNYKTNNWDEPKHITYDAYYPKTKEYVKEALHKWCLENPDTTVVRFTTFMYMFSLVFNQHGKEKYVDWFGYNLAVSPRLIDDFEKEYGYKLRAEHIVDEGYFNSLHRIPSKEFLDYKKFVQKVVTDCVKEIVEITHSYGKEAMMFLGDCWIGAEIYGDYYKELNLDALVGSVGGGVTVRMLSDVKGVKYTEGRFLPYFFPDTFFEGNEKNATAELNFNWITARRAMMRNPLDRIGFGGYLELATKFPTFVERAGQICDEFRQIYQNVKGKNAFNVLKVGVLNVWGKERSWMCFMTAHELWYQQAYSYQGIFEALSGLPVEVSFINFEDVKKGALEGLDVVINAGDAYTAWSGGENWADEQILTAVRDFVYNGGGFIGVGEPTAYQANGRYFQLADVLGVDKEIGFSLNTDKYNITKLDNHFITDGTNKVDYGEDKKNIYALDKTEVLDIEISNRFKRNVNIGEVKMAVNSYGNGRSFYITGLPYSFENSRLLYRALLFVADKEKYSNILYSENPMVECHYYKDNGKTALVNNSNKKEKTIFYDINGKKNHFVLKPLQVLWID